MTRLQESGAGIGCRLRPSPPCSPQRRKPWQSDTRISRPGTRAGVLRVAGVSRRLFRPRLPGRRFLRRHPAGVPHLHHPLHRHSARCATGALSQSCAATAHRADDEHHHGAGVVLLFLRAEPSRAVDRQHTAQRHGAAHRRRAGGVRRASRQDRACRMGGVSRLCRHRAVARRARLGRAVGPIRAGRRAAGHGAVRPRGACSSAAPRSR